MRGDMESCLRGSASGVSRTPPPLSPARGSPPAEKPDQVRRRAATRSSSRPRGLRSRPSSASHSGGRRAGHCPRHRRPEGCGHEKPAVSTGQARSVHAHGEAAHRAPGSPCQPISSRARNQWADVHQRPGSFAPPQHRAKGSQYDLRDERDVPRARSISGQRTDTRG